MALAVTTYWAPHYEHDEDRLAAHSYFSVSLSEWLALESSPRFVPAGAASLVSPPTPLPDTSSCRAFWRSPPQPPPLFQRHRQILKRMELSQAALQKLAKDLKDLQANAIDGVKVRGALDNVVWRGSRAGEAWNVAQGAQASLTAAPPTGDVWNRRKTDVSPPPAGAFLSAGGAE